MNFPNLYTQDFERNLFYKVLNYDDLNFNNEYFNQIKGTAMSTIFASSILTGVASTHSFCKKQLKTKKANKNNLTYNFYFAFIYFWMLTNKRLSNLVLVFYFSWLLISD